MIFKPFLFFKNCPIDKVLPLFDFQNPVKSKYEKKKTFIAEGFLALYGILSEVPPIAYINVNDGDFFQDIYPKDSMLSTQSQKTLAPIYFHKDLANHFVRPDYVNIINLRSYKENKVYTTFVRNIDLLNSLDARTIEILHKVNFYTPYDDLTVLSGNVQVGEAERHSIIQGDNDFRYFENRTVGLTDEATAAIVKLNQQLHANKASVLMCPGDFVSICNNYSLHGKDVVEISDEAMLRIRWSIKTVNVYDLASYGHYFLPNRYGVVKG